MLFTLRLHDAIAASLFLVSIPRAISSAKFLSKLTHSIVSCQSTFPNPDHQGIWKLWLRWSLLYWAGNTASGLFVSLTVLFLSWESFNKYSFPTVFILGKFVNHLSQPNFHEKQEYNSWIICYWGSASPISPNFLLITI